MAGRPLYAGRRSPFKSGDSTVVSLPSRELRQEGVDVDGLCGRDLRATIEDGRFILELPVGEEDGDGDRELDPGRE